MRKLDLVEMENIEGGQSPSPRDVTRGINRACLAMGVFAIAAGAFTLGGAAFVIASFGNAFCIGAQAGQMAYSGA